MSTLIFAQLPTSSLAGSYPFSWLPLHAPAPTPSAPSSDEVVPLNNPPFFPGGTRALENYLDNLDIYPLLARETCTEGTVRVRFRVLPDGSLSEVRVVRSRGQLLDQAALEAVAQMPRWFPAHRAGVAVPHLVELLVTFRLD